MYRKLQIALAGIVVVLFALSALSRRFPDLTWLRAFRFERPNLSDEQRARMRRRANVHAGIQLILLGIVIPMAYVALTVMFFNEFTTMATVWVLAGSLLCVALGVTAIVRGVGS